MPTVPDYQQIAINSNKPNLLNGSLKAEQTVSAVKCDNESVNNSHLNASEKQASVDYNERLTINASNNTGICADEALLSRDIHLLSTCTSLPVEIRLSEAVSEEVESASSYATPDGSANDKNDLIGESISCEEKLISHYRGVRNESRGECVMKYMSIIEKQPTYDVHFYETKDKTGIAWWLGLSYKGISEFEYNDRRTPRRHLPWKQLENLYFREKKFSIEVRDPKRVVHTLSSINLYENAIEECLDTFDDLSTAITDPTTQVSVSRRTFGPCKVTVYVWFAATANLAKCIWSMAVAQHQLYIDKKNSKKSFVSASRTLDEIAADLNLSSFVHSNSRTANLSLHRTISSHSLPDLCIEENALNQIEINKAGKQREMLETLKVRKEALEEAMNKKLAELKSLCLKEGELTGELPPETPLDPNEPIPQIRRRVGTAFTFNDKLLLKPKSEEEEILSKLELEYDIQSKIVCAASKLFNDSSAKKSVRKQRKHVYQQSLAKLKDLEAKLLIVKRQIAASKLAKARRQQSIEDLSEDNISHSTDESQEKCETNLNAFIVTDQKCNANKIVMKRSSSMHSSLPSSPVKFNQEINNFASVRSQSPNVAFALPALPKVIQRPRSAAAKSDHSVDYDTDEESNHILRNAAERENDNSSSVGSSSGGTSSSVIYIGDDKNKLLLMQSPYVNKYETKIELNEGNLYSVPNRRTSIALKSQDDTVINSPNKETIITLKTHKELQIDAKNYLARSNSLDNSRRKGSTAGRRVLLSEDSTDGPHHHHYHNHQPSFRTTKTESTTGLIKVAQLSPRYAESCATTPVPDVKQHYLPSVVNNALTHSECGLNKQSDNRHNNPIYVNNIDNINNAFNDRNESHVRSVNMTHATKTLNKNSYNFDVPVAESYSRDSMSATPTTFPNYKYPESHAAVNSTPVPQPIKTKTWTETSLDFVIQPKVSNQSLNQNYLCSRTNSNSAPLPPLLMTASNKCETSDKIPTPSPPTPLSIGIQNVGLGSPIKSSISPTNNNNIVKVPVNQLSPTVSLSNGVEVNVVSVGHFQPYWEEEKPYELSDFYKYSTKHRKQGNKLLPSTAVKEECNRSKPESGGNYAQNNAAQSQQSPRLSAVTVQMSPNSCQSPNDSNYSLNDSSIKINVAESFHNEMISWFDDRDRNNENATLV